MSRFLVFQHVAAEPLGTLDALLRRRGHRLRFVNFWRDPQARPQVERYDGLIVLGGAMNVEEQAQREHLRIEMHCIEQALKRGLPVLGICLGAQLLAHALGAAVRRLPRAEIGWHRIETTEAGRADPVLAPLGLGAPVFQWHSRGFELPDGAVRLAGSRDCPEQAFRHGSRAYGLQFHLEANAALVQRWLTNPAYRAELESHRPGPDPARILRDTQRLVHAQQARAEAVFNRFLDLLGPAPRGHAALGPAWSPWLPRPVLPRLPMAAESL
ncbi:MAG: type 1 glutamine amidotransferase [Aquimonas sp.]|nr:type 1 glutamine amidotransferase [Aquimonas sp.]